MAINQPDLNILKVPAYFNERACLIVKTTYEPNVVPEPEFNHFCNCKTISQTLYDLVHFKHTLTIFGFLSTLHRLSCRVLVVFLFGTFTSASLFPALECLLIYFSLFSRVRRMSFRLWAHRYSVVAKCV